MIQVTQSALLQALGYGIINSLWQFALLWLVYMLVNSFIKLSSHQRYVSAVMLQATGFTWFIGTVFFYYGESAKIIAEGIRFTQYTSIADPAASVSFKEMFFSMVLKAESVLPYLSIAYLILISFLGIKVLQSYRQTQLLRTQGLTKIDVNWRLFVKQMSAQLGIKQNVQLYISNLIESPVTIGHLKPIILLPVAVVNNLSTQQIEAILIHEMAHIKRFDYVCNIVLCIIEVSLFFNPFMQLISKQLKRERENSCDDWVLQYEYNACNYAKALLQIATYKTMNTPGFAVSAVDNKRALLIRVKRMIEKKDLYRGYRQQIASLLFITLLISCLAWFTPNQYKNKNQLSASVKMVEPPKSIIEKVDNPLFSPVFFLADDRKTETSSIKKTIEPKVEVAAITIEPAKIDKQIATNHIETDIASQLFESKNHQQQLNDWHSYNPVHNVSLDSSLFSRYATRAIVASEIKKLKSEFEKLDNASFFENIDWNKFWDNTKVQKQLEAAFAQLKSFEKQQKATDVMYATGYRNITNAKVQETQKATEELQALTEQKLAKIVGNRIKDIKLEQSALKLKQELNFHFDLPDFSQLNITAEAVPYSYSYTEKPRTAARQHQVTTAPTVICVDGKPVTTYWQERIIVADGEVQPAAKVKSTLSKKIIRIARI